MLNASVEFDERTLKPTYHLLTGVAGASSGIEIDRRFGLPVSVTESARSAVSESGVRALEYLRRLKEQFDEKKQSLEALEEERAAVATRYSRLELEFEKREQQREREFLAKLQATVDDFSARAEKFSSIACGRGSTCQERCERRDQSNCGRGGHLRTRPRDCLSGRRVSSGPALHLKAMPAPRQIEFRAGDRVGFFPLDRRQVESIGDDQSRFVSARLDFEKIEII